MNDKLSEEEAKQFQIDELISLKAIFGDDLRDLRAKNNGKWKPNEVEITLEPLASLSEYREIYVKVDLYVKCGKRYPNVVPDEILLKNAKGLSLVMCQELRLELYKLAKQMKGEVMIFEFANYVRHFLHKHNHPPPKSFYDEMLSNKMKQEEKRVQEIEKKKEIEKLKKEKQLKQLEDELQRKQQNAFREETRLRRESLSSEGYQSLSKIKDLTNKLNQCKENHGIHLINFKLNGVERTAQRCTCLYHDHFGQFIDYLAVLPDNGQLAIITEWHLKISQVHFDEFQTTYITHLSEIENFLFTKLVDLNHQNLVKYISFKYLINSDHITIYLLREHINGTSLSCLLPILNKQTLDLDLIRNYCKDILEGLFCLHQNDCTHQNLNEVNVVLDNLTGNLKLHGYYIEKQIFKLLFYKDNLDLISESRSISTEQMIKDDSYMFGQLIFTILKGQDSLVKSDDLLSDLSHFKFDSDLQDLLFKCLESNENKRWTPNQLLKHRFFTSNSFSNSKSDFHYIKYDAIHRKDHELNDEKNINNLVTSLMSSTSTNSRLNEFEILSEIGKGF